MSWNLKRGERRFPKLPCGCRPVNNGSADVIVAADCSRLCVHGKRWKFAWIEIPMKKAKA